MEALTKLAIRFGSGVIVAAALAVAYNLGRTSTDSAIRPQRHQDATGKDDPALRSALRAAEERLARCQRNLQRYDEHVRQREGEPEANEASPTPSPEPARPNQCTTALQVNELHMLAASCRSFMGGFGAYKEILGSSTIDCDTVLSIRDLARDQYADCLDVLRYFEDASRPDVTSDRRGLHAMEVAYMFKSHYGDVDIDALVKNPACIDRMPAE